MLVNQAGEVFVGQRLDNPGPAWQMPQGGIDEGEAAEAAAFRELFEETGVGTDLVRLEAQTADWMTYELPGDLIGRLWGGKYRGQKQLWFLMRFLGEDQDVDITHEPREFSHWRWLPVSELAGQIVPFKRHIYAAVVAEFSPLL